jgi:two-component system chemotaxis response regulator CheY
MNRCLIIERSSIIRKVTRAILVDFGFDVIEAASGRDGLAMFNRQLPRLAIVDACIDDMPVLDVLRHMRDTGKGRVQIHYCTTGFDMLELQRAHAAGATDVLIKPFDRAALAAKLDSGALIHPDQARPNFYTRLSRSEIVRI